MKTKLFISSLALAALCSALNLHAKDLPATSGLVFGEIPIPQIAAKVNVNGDTITVGTSRIMVSLRLGSPDAVLADGSWLYSNYVVRMARNDAGRPATLVVHFTASQVSSLTMADHATVVALRQTPRHPAKNQFLAASERR